MISLYNNKEGPGTFQTGRWYPDVMDDNDRRTGKGVPDAGKRSNCERRGGSRDQFCGFLSRVAFFAGPGYAWQDRE